MLPVAENVVSPSKRASLVKRVFSPEKVALEDAVRGPAIATAD